MINPKTNIVEKLGKIVNKNIARNNFKTGLIYIAYFE